MKNKKTGKTTQIIGNIATGMVWVFLKICLCVYQFFKFLWYGMTYPIVFVIALFKRLFNTNKEVDVEKLRAKGKKLKEKNIAKEKNIVNTSNYKNDKIKIERKGLGDYLDMLFSAILAIPKNIKKRVRNNALIKDAKNRKDFDTGTMLVDFSDEDNKDNENKGKRITWEYVAINKHGKKVRGYFDAYSRLDVQSFLLGEGLAVYSIKTSRLIQILHGKIGNTGVKVKNKDLIFLLAQLSTYLKSGIPLVDALNILIRQVNKRSYKNLLREVTYDLTVGESFSSALEKRGNSFPRLLINMVKASELTGELPEALDDMVNYYTEVEATRKEMISALTYPSIVFIFTLAVVTFVMIYVVPKFVDIYESMDSSQVPSFTAKVIAVSNYLQNNIFKIFLILVIIILIIAYLYKKVKTVRTMIQWIFMHIPVVKNVIIYNEVTMFSKTFASLLSHNVYITDSMDILNKITNNEFYKMMILDTVANLARGDNISSAFKDQWAFPVPAYEMIVTGEKTGQLAEMMQKVSTYYQDLHRNTVSRIKALLEPILIIFLTFSVGLILLAVIIPMFNMYQNVQNLG